MQIIQLIARRLQLAEQIANYKIINKLPIFDPDREKNLLQFHDNLSVMNNVSPIFIQELFNMIMTHSKYIQYNFV